MSVRVAIPKLIEEANQVVSEASQRNIMLRLLGAAAIYTHCPKSNYLYQRLDRPLSDIDFVSYSKFIDRIEPFFKEMGYVGRDRFNAIQGRTRMIFDDSANNRYVDVFFDELAMSHTVTFSGRLELDYPTITLADLFLAKMQIRNLNEKDIKDTIVMLREHEIGGEEKECVNGEYVAKQLAKDWGFWFDVSTNIQKTKQNIITNPNLSNDDKQDVLKKLEMLIQLIGSEPKTAKWKMRARVGNKRKWYRDVEEVRL
jgi:hypothetical protein